MTKTVFVTKISFKYVIHGMFAYLVLKKKIQISPRLKTNDKNRFEFRSSHFTNLKVFLLIAYSTIFSFCLFFNCKSSLEVGLAVGSWMISIEIRFSSNLFAIFPLHCLDRIRFNRNKFFNLRKKKELGKITRLKEWFWVKRMELFLLS